MQHKRTGNRIGLGTGLHWATALALAAAMACAAPAMGQTPKTDDRFNASLEQMKRAEADYDASRWQQALDQYEQLVRAHPKNPFLLFRYGNAASHLGLYENAAQAYQTALVHDPNYAEAAFNLGLVRLLQSDAAFAHAAEHAGSSPQFAEDARRMRTLSQRMIRITSTTEGAAASQPAKQPQGSGE
ncbi:tetratricopeptide repeat protein [Ralstonia mannitolilytica]|uniref:tetratricopeptide repeat protein n=1 Tax=Ralstonia mannitolilytica TaxID=105219 RepID=UPI000AB06641|nr:tetratricopeptide repeat protein [Ralstonia mannitolilytica]CAJ0890969.1 hypothetical protein R76727_04227 [Ralstonia mannitolilytica]